MVMHLATANIALERDGRHMGTEDGSWMLEFLLIMSHMPCLLAAAEQLLFWMSQHCLRLAMTWKRNM